MPTTRCNAAERAAFRRIGGGGYVRGRYTNDGMEPALGTLAERLDIIYRRHGGAVRITLTDRERRDYAAWLEREGIVNVGNHWSAVQLPLDSEAVA